IQVSDNGAGILKEDMRSAFLPHATSKISAIDDLDSLATLGFRGEALASIASVSEVTLSSACKGQASKIVLSGGTVTFEGEDSRNKGTIITVENLFFNTPARLKFLKKPSSEMRGVLDTVRMLVLANPSVAFTLRNEEGEVLAHEGGSLADAICAVYGAKTVDRMLELNEDKNGSIKVHGFVSACDFTKPNRTYQTIIVNGRAVQDATVQTAVEKAYGDYLMRRAYPMFVIDIIMPFDEVDANVHPSKTEVRFYDRQKVFGAVYRAVQTAVDKSIGKMSVGFDINAATESEKASVADTQILSNQSEDKTEPHVSEPKPTVQTKIDTSVLYGHKTAPINFTPFGVSGGVLRESPYTNKSKSTEVTKWIDTHSYNSTVNIDGKVSSDDANEPISVFDGKIIGQAFATYLLVERDEKLYVIDQHAAHERILYDRIVEKFGAKYMQSLLVPYKLSLTGSEEEYIESVLPALKSLGFEIQHAGATYLVTAVPEPVVDVNFNKFFGELFSNMLSEKELSLAELLKDKLAQQACKAAIKGGEMLSREQIQRVIKSYVDENGELPAKCPHGRPAVIVLEKRDFEKLFKRIV
ncbi:MAG: DNA mismatch repair endonuclease MutL, partial [Clostridia bacterium]|nr:DNA mismatch repair endonuclease MutL [Clostridia bacterium]